MTQNAHDADRHPPFVHLHLHSAYSLAEGAIPISRVRDLCLADGAPAIAVTDTNNLFGALDASETLSAAGIQPITGLQLALAPESCGLKSDRDGQAPYVVLLAQNETGYERLMVLSSSAYLTPADEEVISVHLDTVLSDTSGLILLTGGYDGPVDRLFRDGRMDDGRALLTQFARAFPDRLYVELQRHHARESADVEAALLEEAYGQSLPIVATNQPFFPSPDDYEAHDALLCIAAGAYVHQDDRRQVTPDHYFKSSDDMRKLFADLPEAVETTFEVARRCAFRPKMRAPILPNFLAAGGEGATAEIDGDGAADDTAQDGDSTDSEQDKRIAAESEALREAAVTGLEARLASVELAAERQAYLDRLEIELDIINSMGFPGYFLIVADFIQWSKERNIPVGPGRGSGAGSVVAWALTITDLDPLRYGLLFERFLNPERVSMPDFDIDFCQDRRDEVIRYVQEKYGTDRVAQIITFGKLQARAVLRDVGRVLNMPFPQVDRLCKLVPNNPANPVTLQEAIETEPKLREERDSDEGVAALIEKALKLEGLYRHASTHAAGVVIGDRPLEQLVALYLDPRSDMPATQFNMKWVEPAGLVKFDFLGLKTLTVIARAVGYLSKRDIEVDISAIDVHDRDTFAMLGEGHATGVFQLESAGMRSTLKSMKPDSLEDIIALVSLYRPGPMENIPTYIDRKQGRQEPDYLHEKLEGVLKETYGVIIYQEQVMQIAQILSGYSLGEADLLRRAMGKKKKEEMDKQRKRFVDGAVERDVDARKASGIFDLVQKFAGYGFNKSHAAAYALIAYQTAWLKANHAPEFLAASMSLDRANTDKLAIFMKEARRAEIEVRAPHINHSQADFSVVDGAIVYALSAVKNVGEAAMDHIVQCRQEGGAFTDLFNFAERVDLRQVGKRALENLARAGALDDLGASREEAFAAVELLARWSARHMEESNSDQGGLFQMDSAPGLARPPLPEGVAWLPMDRLTEEFKAIGFYFSGHPLDGYVGDLRKLNVVSFAEAEAAAREGETAFQLAGVVRSVRLRRSKNGNPFAWVELSDASGEFEITVFSRVLDAARDLMEVGQLVLVSVSADSEGGDVRFLAEGMRDLDQAAASAISQLRVSLASVETLERLCKQMQAVKGSDGAQGRKKAGPPMSRAPERGGANGMLPGHDSAKGVAGQVILSFRLPESGREVEIELAERLPATPQTRGALKDVEGVIEVEMT